MDTYRPVSFSPFLACSNTCRTSAVPALSSALSCRQSRTYLVAESSLKSALAVLAINLANVLQGQPSNTQLSRTDVFPHPGGPHKIQLPTPSPASIRALSRLPGPTISVCPTYRSNVDGRERSASLSSAGIDEVTYG